jgi:hypothetical protein
VLLLSTTTSPKLRFVGIAWRRLPATALWARKKNVADRSVRTRHIRSNEIPLAQVLKEQKV